MEEQLSRGRSRREPAPEPTSARTQHSISLRSRSLSPAMGRYRTLTPTVVPPCSTTTNCLSLPQKWRCVSYLSANVTRLLLL